MNKRLIVNITSSFQWRRRPVGIIRVEREVAKGLYRHFAEDVLSVFYDFPNKKWLTISNSLVKEVMADEWCLSNNPDDPIKVGEADFQKFTPNKNDIFVSCGSDWSFGVSDSIIDLYGSNKVFISACHDLIPLLYPEFTSGAEFFEQFNTHYTNIYKCARSVFAVSENSKNDLIKYWQRSGLCDDMPPVDVMPLAGFGRPEYLPLLHDDDTKMLNTLKAGGDYVIYVSTLESRKNHQLILEIWRELYAARGRECPQLIFVGMRGWGCDDLISMMSNMAATKAKKIVWKEGIGDDLLTHLYNDCLFSVFPSFYEGWGLAVTEAASFGKVCIVANNSSLKEAGYGLMPSYHPLDFPGWKDEIIKLLDSTEYRMELEDKIVREFPNRSWLDYSNEFATKIVLPNL